jgi:hypothetical protein
MRQAIRNIKRGLNQAEDDVTPPAKQVPEASSAPGKLETAAEARPVEPKS